MAKKENFIERKRFKLKKMEQKRANNGKCFHEIL